jgi:hypothetical protein
VTSAKRREKLATVLFDLAKYLLTAFAAATLFAKEIITWSLAIFSFLLAIALLIIAWFVTPPD